MTMLDLTVTLGRLSLRNPILVASGTFGYAREMAGHPQDRHRPAASRQSTAADGRDGVRPAQRHWPR